MRKKSSVDLINKIEEQEFEVPGMADLSFVMTH